MYNSIFVEAPILGVGSGGSIIILLLTHHEYQFRTIWVCELLDPACLQYPLCTAPELLYISASKLGSLVSV